MASPSNLSILFKQKLKHITSVTKEGSLLTENNSIHPATFFNNVICLKKNFPQHIENGLSDLAVTKLKEVAS